MNDRARFEYLKKLEEKVEEREGLPHRHGFPFYKWARDFYETRNKNAFLCAGNQQSKSSTHIRKFIEWAGNEELWKTLWRRPPRMFWYLYPSKDLATMEYRTKWLPEFLPRGRFAKSGMWAWEPELKYRQINAIHFNHISIYFRTYMQDSDVLQAGSADMIGCDEELPESLFPELTMRRAATDGYFSMVWTPTLGEPLWKDTIEGRGEREKFPQAFKRQVSLLDCMKYEDGSQSPWTEERVQQVINSCPTPAEVQRRVYGRYVVASGLKYPSFNRDLNLTKKLEKIPSDWLLYSGVDLGSGGEDGHPSSIVFVAVNQTFTKGRVFEGWRGGREENTSAGDVLNRYRQMKGNRVFTGEYYDSQARDFLTISDRAGEAFQGAFKKQDEGQDILNTLFKNQMLDIDNKLELQPLMEELETLLETTKKNKARDDYIDGLRFAVGRIPWDWSSITTNYLVENKTEILDGDALRRSPDQSSEEQFQTLFDQEIEAWNELHED